MKVYPPDVTRPETVVIVKTTPADRSWWADPYPNREAFDRQVNTEIPRMAGGRFGRSQGFDKFGDS